MADRANEKTFLSTRPSVSVLFSFSPHSCYSPSCRSPFCVFHCPPLPNPPHHRSPFLDPCTPFLHSRWIPPRGARSPAIYVGMYISWIRTFGCTLICSLLLLAVWRFIWEGGGLVFFWRVLSFCYGVSSSDGLCKMFWVRRYVPPLVK